MDMDVLLKTAERFGTPTYLYDAVEIKRRIGVVSGYFRRNGTRILYAVKANPNISLLRIFAESGWGADAASPGEIYAALKAGFHPSHIVLTGSNLTEDDIRFALHHKVRLNLDCLEQVERFGSLLQGGDIWLRVNPQIAPRTHPYLATAGPDSKFGIPISEMEAVLEILDRHKLRVSGLHCHIGSMLFETEPYFKALDTLLSFAETIETVESVDIGGGMGHDYSGRADFDWAQLSEGVYKRMDGFSSRTGRELCLYVEVGRWVVAAAGYLLVRVVGRRRVASGDIVGVDCPFTQFIRPALYGAAHKVLNLSGKGRPKRRYFRIVGNACENGDILARNVTMEEVRLGDLLCFCDAGAYCAAMASTYNGRPLPAETLWDGNSIIPVRPRTTFNKLYPSP